MKETIKKIVLGIEAPQRVSDSQYHDKNCPFTGGLAVKNELLKGKVVKKDIHNSATIVHHRSQYVPKYERYEVKRLRLRVHNPPCIKAEVGQEVIVAKTRPLSKTKHHVILGVVEKEKQKEKPKKNNNLEEKDTKDEADTK